MDPLNPMTSTLDPTIAQIYERANAVKSDLRDSMTAAQWKQAEMSEEEKAAAARHAKTRDTARKVLEIPERLRQLVAEGKEEQARSEWKKPLKLLKRWKDSGLGGKDVEDCMEDGESALRGEPPNEKSWVNAKQKN